VAVEVKDDAFAGLDGKTIKRISGDVGIKPDCVAIDEKSGLEVSPGGDTHGRGRRGCGRQQCEGEGECY
jgi:hypothetical protein